MRTKEELMKKMYTNLVRCRKLDEKLIECLMAGELHTFFHSGQGHEAVGVALCALLKEGDYVFYNHRGHGVSKCLPRGMSAEAILAEHYGKATGGAGGFAGFHYSANELGILGMMGMVAGELTLAAGAGIACQLRGKGAVVVCCFGDGATGRGPFHEALLMSSTWKLPVIWVCENNRYQQFTCTDLTHCRPNMADFAQSFDMPATIVDGQEVMALYEAAGPAIERARAGEGPSFLEVKTYRYRSHVEGVPDFSVEYEGGMRPEEEVKDWKKRDPIRLFRESLLEKGILTDAEVGKIDRSVMEEMEEAHRHVFDATLPSPDSFGKALYAD